MNDSFIRRSGRLFVWIFILGFSLSATVFIYLFVSTEGHEPEGFCQRVTDGSGQLPMGPYGVEGIEYTCRIVMQGEANYILFGYAIYLMIAMYLLYGLWKMGRVVWHKAGKVSPRHRHDVST